MNIQGLDKELCERRNRVVARREDVEGVPVRLLAGTADEFRVIGESSGQLPDTLDHALAVINSKLPEGATELTADDVYIHYLEAANSNFIGDRFMFLGESTLRNIATDAANGFAFMNSHRTGSVSQPSELPFGKTFAGQFQAYQDETGQPQQRALVAFYMLRGVKPNGENGPTTDDLHKMIVGGQIADVSVGLMSGEAMCDVCGVNLRETECAHAPGTKRSMTDLEVDAQAKRGVPSGKASYTLENARCGEVSAVFDGAVPGAGVKKVMSLRQKGKLNHREWKEARAVFGSMLNGDLSMDNDLFEGVAEAVETGVRAALAPVEPIRSEPRETESIQAQASTVTSEPQHKQGVEPMAEEITATQTEADANEFAKLNTELAALRVERDKLAERTARLEADAMNSRFAAEVEGTVSGGVRWFGDHTQHKTMLSKLAGAFGEQSQEVQQYIQQNRAYAVQLAESKLFEELGATGASNEQRSALDELQARATDIHSANPRLTKEQAFANATQAYPELYERYVAEQRGGK